MPSPFPGMDPYLEDPAIWGDFHQNLAVRIQGQLASVTDPRYFVAIESKVTYDEITIEAPDDSRLRIARPDVGIWASGERSSSSSATAIAPAPFEVEVTVEVPVKQLAVQVRSAQYGTLVTSIEILSPVNKRPGHRAAEAYQRKRRHLLRREVNLLEIDLLREGQRTPPIVKTLPVAPYYIFLTRGSTTSMSVWPIGLRDPFPIVPVPLQFPDPDVPLDLGSALHDIYETARYRRRLNYDEAPPPPQFSPEDAAWIDRHLRVVGVRE